MDINQFLTTTTQINPQSWIPHWVTANQIILGVVLGAVTVFLRQLGPAIWYRIKNMLTIGLVVDEAENMAGELFQTLNEWVYHNRIPWLTRVYELNRQKRIVAGLGLSVMVYEGKLFWCYMSRKENAKGFSTQKVGTYSLYTFKWNYETLNKLVMSATAPRKENFTAGIYLYDGHMNLNKLGDFADYIKNQKQYVAQSTYDTLDKIFARFVAGRESYDEQCRAYKETIMLFGPPGTGKTNLCRHFCAKYNIDLYMVKPDQLGLLTFSAASHQARLSGGLRFFLLDDFDSCKAFQKVAKAQTNSDSATINIQTNSDGETGFSMSTSRYEALNALDGAAQADGVMIGLATNHIGKIDEAVYRDGRVDHLIPVEYMTINEVVGILGWTADDSRYQTLISSSVTTHLPASRINSLMYAKTVDTVREIIASKELTAKYMGIEHVEPNELPITEAATVNDECAQPRG